MWWIRLLLWTLIGFSGKIQVIDEELNEQDRFIEKGQLVFRDKTYQYGSLKRGDENRYDAYLKYKANDDLQWTLLVYDSGDSDSIRYAAILSEDRIVLVMERFDHSQGGEVPIFIDTTLVLCNEEGEMINSKNLGFQYSGWYNQGYRLILRKENDVICHYDVTLSEVTGSIEDVLTVERFTYQYQGEATVNHQPVDCIDLIKPGFYQIAIQEKSFSQVFNVTIEAQVEGVVDGGEYTEAILIDSSGDLFLNDEPYVSMTPILTPGNYCLRIDGEGGYQETISFILHATIDNVAEGAFVTGPIRIFTNGTTVFINDYPYGNQALTKAGTYQLRVLGVNGYLQQFQFHITPEVMGVQSEREYHTPFEFFVNGEGELNGIKVSGAVEISEAGNYELNLFCADQVFETIRFSLVMPEEEQGEKTPFPIGMILFGICAVIGLVLLLKKH